MASKRAASREKTSSALKAKATTQVKRPTSGYNQRQAAQRNARTVTQAKRAAGVAPPQKQTPTVQSWMQNVASSLGNAAQSTLGAFGTAGQATARTAANVYNRAVAPVVGTPQINLSPSPQEAMVRRAEEMQNWYRQQLIARQQAAPERSEFGQKKPHRPGSTPIYRMNQQYVQPGAEGYTEPAPTQPSGGYSYPEGSSMGGYAGYPLGYPEFSSGGGGGMYAEPGGAGYNPARAQAPVGWQPRLTWRF